MTTQEKVRSDNLSSAMRKCSSARDSLFRDYNTTSFCFQVWLDLLKPVMKQIRSKYFLAVIYFVSLRILEYIKALVNWDLYLLNFLH